MNYGYCSRNGLQPSSWNQGTDGFRHVSCVSLGFFYVFCRHTHKTNKRCRFMKLSERNSGAHKYNKFCSASSVCCPFVFRLVHWYLAVCTSKTFCFNLLYSRNEYQESSWGKGRPAFKADTPIAICDPVV
jgi:hypothetical protein